MLSFSKLIECSRAFALPTTIFSWLIVFTFAVINSGNKLYGLIALIGISLAHLSTNILDDYFDYKSLIKAVNYDKNEYLKNSQKTKCRYLINHSISESQLLIICGIYLSIALLIGLFLYKNCGICVLYYMVSAAILMLAYPFASKFYLSECFIGLVYGPILFGGMYYVMTGTQISDVFLLMLPSVFMTITLLYIHSVMDFNFDKNENKKTIANSFESPLQSLVILKYFLIAAYSSLFFLCILDVLDWQILLTLLSIPLALDLYESMKEYTENPNFVPRHKWYHFPMENLKKLDNTEDAAFMIRIYQARNLMMYFSILFTIGIILSLAL